MVSTSKEWPRCVTLATRLVRAMPSVKKSVGSYYGAAEKPRLFFGTVDRASRRFSALLTRNLGVDANSKHGRSSSSIMRVSANMSAILEDSGYKVVQEPDGSAALVLL